MKVLGTVYILMITTDEIDLYDYDYDKYEILGVYDTEELAISKLREYTGGVVTWEDEDAPELMHSVEIIEQKVYTQN